MSKAEQTIEFGDFQTPAELARLVCVKLRKYGLSPDVIIEPTCGKGSFVMAAAESFPHAEKIMGFDINPSHLEALSLRVPKAPKPERVRLEVADFFATDWKEKIGNLQGAILVIGNFPWVTSATQGVIGGVNLPGKSNFLGFNGLDAITGKANFDISEWMLLDVLRWFTARKADIAMLVKTTVARKVLAYIERQKLPLNDASIVGIDAKKSFGAAVDACLLVIRLNPLGVPSYDYSVYSDFGDLNGRRIGHRQGMIVSDLDGFRENCFLFGKSPQKWRSGIKHDAAAVMELTRTKDGYVNGFNEIIDLEDTYLFPLLKGSDIGSRKEWRERFVLVPQRRVGESTDLIRGRAPKTWAYLDSHAKELDARRSTIYKKNPRFSIFGVGDYAFLPWHVCICGLYKSLRFRLVGPIEGRPVLFDDTVYFLSFESEKDSREALERLESKPATELLSSLIFWDEKRPIKTGILNVLDWSKLGTERVVTTSRYLEATSGQANSF